MGESSSLGQRLKEVRKSKKLSQGDMAASLGFKSRGFWSELEAGKKEPSGSLMLLLSEVHNVNRDWLLTGEGEMWKQEPEAEQPPEIKLSERLEPEPDIKDLLKEALKEESAGEHAHKLILAYLEELLDRKETTGYGAKDRPQIRRTAEPELEVTEVRMNIPELPEGLNEDEAARWERNRGVLERWMNSEAAIWAPQWALERFCRDVVEMYGGGRLEEVTGLLKDFMEEGPKNQLMEKQ